MVLDSLLSECNFRFKTKTTLDKLVNLDFNILINGYIINVLFFKSKYSFDKYFSKNKELINTYNFQKIINLEKNNLYKNSVLVILSNSKEYIDYNKLVLEILTDMINITKNIRHIPNFKFEADLNIEINAYVIKKSKSYFPKKSKTKLDKFTTIGSCYWDGFAKEYSPMFPYSIYDFYEEDKTTETLLFIKKTLIKFLK